MKRTGIRRGTKRLRRTKLEQRGRRYAEKRERDFGDKALWIAIMPCDVCRVDEWYTRDPHHEPPRSLGGKKEDLVPLCRRHHNVRHSLGPTRFNERYGVNLVERAAYWERKWRETK